MPLRCVLFPVISPSTLPPRIPVTHKRPHTLAFAYSLLPSIECSPISLDMDDAQPLPVLNRIKRHCVRGPRPCSWVSSSSESSSSEHRDIWSWTVQGSSMHRRGTLRSTASSEASDYTASSLSSPVSTPNVLEFGDKSYSRRAHRRKPAGPRPPRNSSSFDVRPSLLINTSPPTIPQFRRENTPTTPPLKSADILPLPSTKIPLPIVNSPTNFLLDWDAIFEILGCSDTPPDSVGSW